MKFELKLCWRHLSTTSSKGVIWNVQIHEDKRKRENKKTSRASVDIEQTHSTTFADAPDGAIVMDTEPVPVSSKEASDPT